jgi:hypothetical protein
MEQARSRILAFFVLGLLAIFGVGMFFFVRDASDAIPDPVGDFQTQAAQLLDPTPTIIVDPNTIILQVQALSRLETIQYSLEKVITAETNQGTWGWLFGDRLLFIAHGTVIAGVDLEKLGPEDLFVQGTTLTVRLPAAEIFIATLDNDQSYVYDRNIGALNKGEVDLETAARQSAEQEILAAALEDGILAQAQTNAENYLYGFFRALGFNEVQFLDPIQ